MTEESEYLTASEIAHNLRINQVTVIRWCKSGYLPGAIKVGRYYRIPRTKYEEFLKRRNLQSPTE